LNIFDVSNNIKSNIYNKVVYQTIFILKILFLNNIYIENIIFKQYFLSKLAKML